MVMIDELRKVCEHLYLYIPTAVADDVKKKAESVIAELEKKQFYIDCLHSGGVDNWDWYGDSLQPYWEKYDG